MRHPGLTCLAFLVLALPLSAQPKSTAPPATSERLDLLLTAWEQRMTNVENFSTKLTRTETHPLTKKATTFVGEAAFMKPNLARIDLTHQDEVGKKDTEKTNFERMYCNGQFIFEYSPREKLIVVHDIPKNDPTADNMILAFLRSMKVEVARKRFEMALTKEDAWYAYIYISPKTDADKQEFSAAQLTVWIKNPNPQNQPNIAMLPAGLWYRQPNGKEVTYLFSDMQPNGKLDKDSFVPRQITGYEVKKASSLKPAVAPKNLKPTARPQMP